jgi:hypothetical protein
MKPEELARQIEEIIFNADAVYSRQITRIQSKLYNEVLLILKQLETDKDGYIKQSNTNRRLMDKADLKINEVMGSDAYEKAVNDYVRAIPKIDGSNQKYFSTLTGFNDSKLFLRSLQTDAIKAVEKYILQDGLQAQVINPLSRILNQNINSGGMFSAFLDEVRTYIKGNSEVEGRAMRYTRVYLKDTLFQYARSYQQAVTADLGLQWYLYSGGLIDKSREFCIERNGKFFHQTEIESWASLEWKGKNPLTTEASIFVLVGGYSCGHQLIPVDEIIVPVEDLERVPKKQ